MITKLSDIKITMLAWAPMPPHGVRPPECWCLFSNGKSFVVGVLQGNRIVTHIGADVAASLMTHWAKLNNLSAIFEGRA